MNVLHDLPPLSFYITDSTGEGTENGAPTAPEGYPHRRPTNQTGEGGTPAKTYHQKVTSMCLNDMRICYKSNIVYITFV